MSGTFRNDISTTGFIESKKVGKIAGALEALPVPSAEYEGFTIQYLGSDESTGLRPYNTYMCQKQADGTYAWIDNSPAGGGKWGKIKGNIEDQPDLRDALASKAVIDDEKVLTSVTWSSSKLKTEFAALTGTVNVVVVDVQPTLEAATPKTIYYCGTSAPYHIYLCAYNAATPPVKSWYDMGTSEISLENYYTKTVVEEKIGAETSARETAITTEKTARETSDSVLAGNISSETIARTSADAALQANIDKKQNKVIYVDALPDPSTLETGDLVIKDATDGVWSRVNPETIIDDSTLSGSKTFSSNLLNNKWNQMDAAKQNRVLTGTTDPSPTAGVFGDIYIKYGEEDTWSKVEVNNIIKDGVTATTSTWSSSELKARFQTLAGGARVEMVTTKPETGVLNTTYYVGTASPYHIWLYANNSSGVATWFDLGVTSIDFSDYYKKTEADGLFLRQTGGPLTGAITAKDLAVIKGMDDSGYITMMGGSGAGGGAYLDLIGKDYSSDKGSFVLHASNGTVNNKLIGGVDGSLTWMGKSVMTSGIEDITAEFFQNDTMTGHHKATKYGKMITVAANGCSHTGTLFTMLPKYRPAGPMTICVNAIAFPDGEMSLVQLQGDSGNAICYGDRTKNWYWSCTFVIA